MTVTETGSGAASPCRWRRAKNGRWAVMGPASVVKAGAIVSVVSKSGVVRGVHIARTGKPFEIEVDGATQMMVYGYPPAEEEAPSPARSATPAGGEPATEKQLAAIQRLAVVAGEAVNPNEGDKARAALRRGLSRKEASALIDHLKWLVEDAGGGEW